MQQGLEMVLLDFFFFVEIVPRLALEGFDGNLLDDARHLLSIGCALEDGLQRVLPRFFLAVMVARLAETAFGSLIDALGIGRPNSGNS